MSIYQTAVKKPITTILVFMGIVLFGLFSYTKLSVDLMPDFDMNRLTVMCSYPGASASDIETNVTRKLEDTFNSVENLKRVTSNSKENFSIISLEYEWGTDLDVATNELRDKIGLIQSSLPEGASTPVIFKFSTSMIPIMSIVATAEESLPALYKILDEQVANTLNRVDGVGSVSISGAPKRQVQVLVDPVKLESYNLSISQIGQIIGAENKDIPGGSFDIGSGTYNLRVQGEFNRSNELEDIVVSVKNGRSVLLKDVAIVNDTVQEKLQESFTNGTQGALISIVKQSGANTVEICDQIKKVLPEIQRSLPSDVKLEILIDNSKNVMNSLNSLRDTVFFAFLFVMIVVWFFLGRWRATFIIILTIPVSLVVSFIYLMVAGETLNVITLSSLSIAIGMVVDDAIVVLENITTHIERGSPPKQAAIYATNEVGVAVIATTLTVAAVFAPLTMVGGMAGIMFKPLGWMVTVIVVFSTIVALTLTPMLCSQMLRLDPKHSKFFLKVYGPIENGLNKLDNWYHSILQWSLRHRRWVLGSAILIFVSSLGLLNTVGTEFFPASDNGRTSGKVYLPIGTRMEEARSTAEMISQTWRSKYPELKAVNYTVGVPDDNNVFGSIMENGTHIISYNIVFTDPMSRKRTMFELLDSMRVDMNRMPEIERYSIGTSSGGMGGSSTANVEIYGYDFDVTNLLAREIRDKIRNNVKGAVDINISRADFNPEYHVEFDRQKLALNGLNVSSAAATVRNNINGMVASQYREDGDEYDILVRYPKHNRTSVEDIENILIYNSQGSGIRVRDLGKVVETFGPPTIDRQDRERIVKVETTISGVPMSDVVAGINAQLATVDFPAEVKWSLGGSIEDQNDSFGDMGMLLLLVIVLVYIVMASQFETFSGPFIIMLSLPFAFTGVFLALAMTGTTLNLTSMIGAVMLVGIVVKNGIVLVDFINLNRERGESIFDAVANGGKSRLRPVLMTTLTTILGMIPMALGIGEGSEMWAPMGIAIIGGLTVSTLLTLVVIPVVYTFFAARDEKKKKLKEAQEIELLNSLK